MSYRIKFSQKARAEAVAAARWIGQYAPEKSSLWYFDLEQRIESLKNSPARCPLAPESRTFKREIRQLIFGKYRILFRIDDETVHVMHIRHSSQQMLSPETEIEDENDSDD